MKEYVPHPQSSKTILMAIIMHALMEEHDKDGTCVELPRHIFYHIYCPDKAQYLLNFKQTKLCCNISMIYYLQYYNSCRERLLLSSYIIPLIEFNWGLIYIKVNLVILDGMDLRKLCHKFNKFHPYSDTSVVSQSVTIDFEISWLTKFVILQQLSHTTKNQRRGLQSSISKH